MRARGAPTLSSGRTARQYPPGCGTFPPLPTGSPPRSVDNWGRGNSTNRPNREGSPVSPISSPASSADPANASSSVSRAELDERVAGQTVPRLFLATVESRADAVALRWKDGAEYRELTFAEYGERAARLAAALADDRRRARHARGDAPREPSGVPHRRHGGAPPRGHADLDLQLVVGRSRSASCCTTRARRW